MTSPRDQLAALRHRPSLRTELVLVTVALTLVGLGIAAVIAVTVLRGYLLAQVDAQLHAAAHSVTGQPTLGGGPPPPGDGDGPGDSHVGAPSPFTITYLDASGHTASVVGNPLTPTTNGPDLPSLTLDEVRARTGHPYTVAARGGGPDWRVLAVPEPDGTGSVLVAQSLGPLGSTVSRLAWTEAAVGLLLALVLAAAASFLVRRSLRPLRAVEDTAGALASGDLARRVPPIDPRTEVGQLAASFNRMAERIQSAFAERAASEASARESERRMRRFAADASHELRTPLTSIRGYAELYQHGALTKADDVPRAMARIEEQATRMGVLVDDLLLLARMDQQRPLDRAPVDLVALALDTVADARLAQPTRRIDAAIEVPDGRLVVAGDEAGLRQVLTNLLSNACRHTPTGTQVTVQVRRQADQAVVEVCDDGPGLSAADATRVFERFYRTDGSRTRDLGGTGLGLSIVDAMVRAHGGHVELDTAPGRGATFAIVLPLEPGTGLEPAAADGG